SRFNADCVTSPVRSDSGSVVFYIVTLQPHLDSSCEQIPCSAEAPESDYLRLNRCKRHCFLHPQSTLARLRRFLLSSIPSLLRRRNPLTRRHPSRPPHRCRRSEAAVKLASGATVTLDDGLDSLEFGAVQHLEAAADYDTAADPTWQRLRPTNLGADEAAIEEAAGSVGQRSDRSQSVAAGTDEEPEDDTIVFSSGESGYATLRRNMSEKVAQMLSLGSDLMPDYRLQSPKVHRCTILHYSPFKAVWDWLILILVIYTAIFTPYVAAFLLNDDRRDRKLKWTTQTPWPSLTFLVDVMFIVDILINFRTTYVNKNDEVSLASGRTLFFKGWFLIDVVAAIPFDLLLWGSGSTSDEFRVARKTRPVFGIRSRCAAAAHGVFRPDRSLAGLYLMLRVREFIRFHQIPNPAAPAPGGVLRSMLVLHQRHRHEPGAQGLPAECLQADICLHLNRNFAEELPRLQGSQPRLSADSVAQVQVHHVPPRGHPGAQGRHPQCALYFVARGSIEILHNDTVVAI
uniref:Ion_trans domain-containing protein n=1 Tax=Macrostomum lignano TaxID=282301 RepID=A0A1I8FGS5_9PLAT